MDTSFRPASFGGGRELPGADAIVAQVLRDERQRLAQVRRRVVHQDDAAGLCRGYGTHESPRR